jgi:hypothetical protein
MTTEGPRNASGLEIPALFAVLVGGAVLRYWLSTVVPFDAREFAMLSEAQVRTHGVRGIFIMINGMSLLALYLFVRRSLGIAAAFMILLLLQASLTFQVEALRIRWARVPILVAGIPLAWWRLTRPAGRLPGWLSTAAAVVAALLATRELYLMVTLIPRLDAIRSETRADSEALHRSLVACGGGLETRLEDLRGCELAWPTSRSLAQQEALLAHAQMLGDQARMVAEKADLTQMGEVQQVAIFDREGAAFLLVEPGETVRTAMRVLGELR